MQISSAAATLLEFTTGSLGAFGDDAGGLGMGNQSRQGSDVVALLQLASLCEFGTSLEGIVSLAGGILFGTASGGVAGLDGGLIRLLEVGEAKRESTLVGTVGEGGEVLAVVGETLLLDGSEGVASEKNGG
ncbi:hypothetical protein HG531_000645 [Fusarium graminearum]|nr:hypothetical protein HG531_000645 [Fusarium graminearum]